jgi:hypothetical protein
MSHAYEPLTPVYKPESERTIELEEVTAQASPAADSTPSPNKCEWKCENECKSRSCFTRKGNKLTKGQIVCRCLGVTLAVMFTLWVVTGTFVLAYLGTKAHMCLHPRHTDQTAFSFSPSQITSLDLTVIAGKVSVRSCSKASNVSVTVRTYALSDDLLDTFDLQVEEDASSKTLSLVVNQPSFDFRHCQHAWIDVIVPEHAQLDVTAQALVGNIEIEGNHHALRHVQVSSKVARVSVRNLNASGILTLENTLGLIDARHVASAGLVTRQGVGVLSVHEVETPKLDSALDIGHACAGNLDVPQILLQADVAYLSLWNVNSSNVSASVAYGKLSVVPVAEFEGHFKALSPYGFLDVSKGSLAAEIEYSTNNGAHIEGTMGSAVADVSLQSVYGAVNFFVPNPHTKYWHEEHDGKEKHHH